MPNDSKPIVLVADDEPSMVAMLSSHLGSKGFTVLEASDGDQAWELAHEHLPDLVLLDVMMPGMSGWEVCRKIREAVSLAHTGVIMLTGIGENLNEMTSPLYGADAYLDKPFEFSDLDQKITETLDRRSAGALGRADGDEEDAGVVKKALRTATPKPAKAKSEKAKKPEGMPKPALAKAVQRPAPAAPKPKTTPQPAAQPPKPAAKAATSTAKLPAKPKAVPAKPALKTAPAKAAPKAKPPAKKAALKAKPPAKKAAPKAKPPAKAKGKAPLKANKKITKVAKPIVKAAPKGKAMKPKGAPKKVAPKAQPKPVAKATPKPTGKPAKAKPSAKPAKTPPKLATPAAKAPKKK